MESLTTLRDTLQKKLSEGSSNVPAGGMRYRMAVRWHGRPYRHRRKTYINKQGRRTFRKSAKGTGPLRKTKKRAPDLVL